MKRKVSLDRSKYCPDSCDSLYGGKCIMRLDGKYVGGFPLPYEHETLTRHYIRRETCPLRDKNDEGGV